MSWLYADSATVASGSISVSVSGNVDFSKIKAGWALQIGSHTSEVKSGTAPDGSGNSSIILVIAWDGASVVAQPAKVIPTSGALLEALEGLNETNDYAISVHKALSDVATLDADITLTESSGVSYTFSSMPKNARLIGESIEGLNQSVNSMEGEVDQFLLNVNERLGNTPFEIDLRGLDGDSYYPVFLEMSAKRAIDLKIYRQYSYDRDGDASLAGLFLHVIAVGGSWGGNPIKMKVVSNEQTYLRTVGVIGFGGYSHPMVFLRGGYLYNGLSSESVQGVQIFTEKTTYYLHATDPKYNLTAGPVDDAAIDAYNGALPMSSSFVDLGRSNIADLGGYSGAEVLEEGEVT